MERAIIQTRGNRSELLAFDTPTLPTKVNCAGRLEGQDLRIQLLDDVIVAHIRRALNESGGKMEGKAGAAELLGLHPSTLRGKMRKFGI